MTTFLYPVLSVLVISLVSLVGVFTLAVNAERIKKYVSVFIGLAVGALLGDVFIHLIPESLEGFGDSPAPGLLIIAGIFIFFIIEKFFHWHHHGEDTKDNHVHPVGKLVLFSDGFHNLIDGIIIGVSFLVSVPVGIATTLAVILHEIPQEIGDFAVLLHAGYTKTKALWLNFLSALVALVGVLVALVFGNNIEGFTVWMLPIAAGGFIYIALADLIPELQKTKRFWLSATQILAIVIGILSMLALTLLE